MIQIKKYIKYGVEKYKFLPIAAKAALWFVVCSIVQKGISFITTPIFTRIMSTEQYGQFSVYSSWLQIFTIITTLRLDYAVFNKGMSKYKDDRDGYTATMQTVTVLLTVAVFSIYWIFKDTINAIVELPTEVMILMFVELFFIPATQFWTLRKRYEYKYKPVALVTLSIAILNAIIGVYMVTGAEEKGYARIISCVLVSALIGIILFIINYMRGKGGWFKIEYATFAIMFNLPLLVHYISIYVLDQFDRIMIQKMVGLSAAALYSVAYSVGMLTKIVTQSINSALVPWQYSQLEKKNLKKLDDVLFQIFLLIAAICLVFSAFTPEFIRIFAGENYVQASYVVVPIILSTFFTFAYTTFANVEFYYDQNKFTMFISVGGAVLNVLMNYVGISLFGYEAAAYTTLICYVIFALAHYVYMTVSVKRKLQVDSVFNTKRFISLCGVSLLIGVIIILLYDAMVLRYIFALGLIVVAVKNRNKIFDGIKNIKR